MKLTAKQIEKREQIINQMIAKVGKEKVKHWLNDKEKLSVINALAASRY